MPLIFILFVAVPIVEIWVLIEVGSRFGALYTILLVILTAVIGSVMLRTQGLSILSRVRSQLASNRLPAAELLEGAFLLVGGVLLLTPGFVTDAVGFLCLLPITRRIVVRAMIARFSVRGYTSQPWSSGDHPNAGRTNAGQFGDADSKTIEGEYRREK